VNPAPPGHGPISLGLASSLLPAGTLTTSTQGHTTDTDADVTGALAPFIDVAMTRWLAVGFSPQFVLKLKAPAATESWTEYDLHARLTLFDPRASDRRLYARLSPGYSILSPPSGTLPSGVSDPAGFVTPARASCTSASGSRWTSERVSAPSSLRRSAAWCP
jgi:hypothetical protein